MTPSASPISFSASLLKINTLVELNLGHVKKPQFNFLFKSKFP